MAFSIAGEEPPAYARPSAPFTVGVIHPASSGYDGEGRPVGVVGQIEAEVGRSTMSAAGHSWWMAHFASTPTAPSVTVTNLNIYDPLKNVGGGVYGGETTYASATMHRPVWESSNLGAWYKNYRIRFTALTT